MDIRLAAVQLTMNRHKGQGISLAIGCIVIFVFAYAVHSIYYALHQTVCLLNLFLYLRLHPWTRTIIQSDFELLHETITKQITIVRNQYSFDIGFACISLYAQLFAFSSVHFSAKTLITNKWKLVFPLIKPKDYHFTTNSTVKYFLFTYFQ